MRYIKRVLAVAACLCLILSFSVLPASALDEPVLVVYDCVCPIANRLIDGNNDTDYIYSACYFDSENNLAYSLWVFSSFDYISNNIDIGFTIYNGHPAVFFRNSSGNQITNYPWFGLATIVLTNANNSLNLQCNIVDTYKPSAGQYWVYSFTGVTVDRCTPIVSSVNPSISDTSLSVSDGSGVTFYRARLYSGSLLSIDDSFISSPTTEQNVVSSSFSNSSFYYEFSDGTTNFHAVDKGSLLEGTAVVTPEYDESGNITNYIINNEIDISPLTESDEDPRNPHALNSSELDELESGLMSEEVTIPEFDSSLVEGSGTYWNMVEQLLDTSGLKPVVLFALAIGLASFIIGRKT